MGLRGWFPSTCTAGGYWASCWGHTSHLPHAGHRRRKSSARFFALCEYRDPENRLPRSLLVRQVTPSSRSGRLACCMTAHLGRAGGVRSSWSPPPVCPIVFRLEERILPEANATSAIGAAGTGRRGRRTASTPRRIVGRSWGTRHRRNRYRPRCRWGSQHSRRLCHSRRRSRGHSAPHLNTWAPKGHNEGRRSRQAGVSQLRLVVFSSFRQILQRSR